MTGIAREAAYSPHVGNASLCCRREGDEDGLETGSRIDSQQIRASFRWHSRPQVFWRIALLERWRTLVLVDGAVSKTVGVARCSWFAPPRQRISCGSKASDGLTGERRA
jgi:hypothetical protein